MSGRNSFSIDINALPIVDGLSPVQYESAAAEPSTAHPTRSASTSARKGPPAPINRGKGSLRGGRPTDTILGSNSSNTGHTMSGTVSPPRQSAMSQVVGSTPRRSSSPFSHSPTRAAMRSGSPRHISPATSQIFERDVQESSIAELSPAIPAHIQTEDHIPPVLDASSLAITDKALDPSDVEIVMHAAHQPAAAGVAASTSGQPLQDTQFSSGYTSQADFGLDHTQSIDALASSADNASYAVVDPLDPRRLSFISFADMVHAEHEAQHEPSVAPAAGGARSPSPVRSPSIVPGSTLSPPPTSMLGIDPASSITQLRRGSASFASPHAQAHGDLMIETMAQALEQPLVATATGSEAGGGHRNSLR